MSITLERFDEAIAGATNDEVVELSYRLFEELAERAGNITRLALDTGDRDAINEASTYVNVVDDLFPFSPQVERVKEASYYVDKCERQLDAEIATRGESGAEQTKMPHGWMVGQTPATRRLEQAQREEERRRADELVGSVDFSRDAVLAAFQQAAAGGGALQARDVAIALCPDAEASDVPGRQQVINRVGAVIRRLAADGVVAKASEGDGSRRTCRWSLADA